MDQRENFVIQIMEKMGAPLTAAVTKAAVKNNIPANDRNDAEQVAMLLGKAVQLSVALATSVEIKQPGPEGDGIRLALASLSSSLIAAHYEGTGKAPTDDDIKNMNTALESILTFSDNFAPAAHSIKRLEHIDPTITAIADDNQIAIQYINALTPVITAIATFSFGQQEQKLTREVTERLVEKAKALAEKNLPDGADEATQKQAQLQCLKIAAELYAVSHHAETVRLLSSKEEDRQQSPSLDPVWESFEKKIAIADTISNITGSDNPETEQTASAPQTQIETPATPPQETNQPETPAPAAQSESAPDNPMGFFKPGAKPAEQEQPETTTEPEPDNIPAAPETPAPQEQQSESPPPPEPEAAPESAPAEQSKPDDGPYNPMGFFKPGTKPKENGDNTDDESNQS